MIINGFRLSRMVGYGLKYWWGGDNLINDATYCLYWEFLIIIFIAIPKVAPNEIAV